MKPKLTSALKGLGEPRGGILVIDPGGSTGTALWSPHSPLIAVDNLPLDDLPTFLRATLQSLDISMLVAEDYHLRGALSKQQSGSAMPSAQGIGMCRVACEWTDTPMFLAQPGCKSAGRAALDRDGREARERCRNEHQRDVVDILGFALRELRR